MLSFYLLFLSFSPFCILLLFLLFFIVGPRPIVTRRNIKKRRKNARSVCKGSCVEVCVVVGYYQGLSVYRRERGRRWVVWEGRSGDETTSWRSCYGGEVGQHHMLYGYAHFHSVRHQEFFIICCLNCLYICCATFAMSLHDVYRYFRRRIFYKIYSSNYCNQELCDRKIVGWIVADWDEYK